MGEGGYKVTLKDVHAELINLRDVEFKKIWDSQNDICRKLDKYNGLHEKVDKLKKEVYKDREVLGEVKKAVETKEATRQKESEVRAEIRQEEHDKFMRILKLILVLLAAAGFIGAYLW